MRYSAVLIILIGLVAGCATAPTTTTAELTPFQAILSAAERPEEGVTGVFRMEVRGGGRQDDFLYLNSEADYRDQRCLTLALPQSAALALEHKLGGDPTVALKGKTLRVTGTAKRTTIGFRNNGVMTDKYYYQTHVLITDPSQISIVP